MSDLDSPEIKAAIADAVKSAVEEATQGLKTKNTELAAKLKLATKNAEISPDDYNRLKDENEKLSEQIEQANKQLKLGVSEYDKLKKNYEDEVKFSSNMFVDNQLADAFSKSGVKPELSKAVKAMLASQVSIKTEGETRAAVIGDKPIMDYVTEWAKSDEGKHFIAAPANSGGGAQGGNKSTGQATMQRAAFDGLSPKDRATKMSEGVVLTD